MLSVQIVQQTKYFRNIVFKEHTVVFHEDLRVV